MTSLTTLTPSTSYLQTISGAPEATQETLETLQQDIVLNRQAMKREQMPRKVEKEFRRTVKREEKLFSKLFAQKPEGCDILPPADIISQVKFVNDLLAFQSPKQYDFLASLQRDVENDSERLEVLLGMSEEDFFGVA